MYKKIAVILIIPILLLGADKYLSNDAISIPRMLNYQGKLTNLSGNPVNDSTYSITFRLFTNSSGGSAFWNETQNVITRAGLFNVLLGSTTQIDTIPQAGNCYLEMQVNPNPAMTPRVRLVSSAYAYLAKKADTADYVRNLNIQYVDSARVSTNSYKIQGKDTIALSTKFVDEGQASSISSGMIIDGTIQRVDVAINFKAPYSDTSDYVRNINVTYVDSARVAANAHKLQGKDTTALSAKFVDENQANAISNTMLQNNAVTSAKIQDSTITRADVIRNFKSPYADTSDYARAVTVQYVDSARISVNAYNAYKLQGKDTIALDSRYVNEGQTNSISSAMITDNTITRNDVATNFKAPLADTADYARVIPGAIDSARVAANAHNAYKLQGKDTTSFDTRYVNEGQANSVTSGMITDSTITRADIIRSFKAPYSDTADYVRNINVPYVDSTRIAVNAYNAYRLQGKDTTALSSKFIDEGQVNAISTGMIQDSTITNAKIARDAVTSDKIQDGTIQVSDLSFTPATRPFTPLINGSEIAKPCTLEASVSQLGDAEKMTIKNDNTNRDNKRLTGNAVFNVKNNGSGDGIRVIDAGGDGINVEHANGAGISVGNAEQDGLNIGTANWDGIYIWRTSGDGVYIESTNSNGLRVNKAVINGVNINQANGAGVYVDSTGGDGYVVHHAGDNGLRVTYANNDGVYVDSAGDRGVYAYGDYGGVYGQSNTGFGVKAQSNSGNALEVEGASQFSGQITSTATDKSAPISVASTAACPNLNSDLLDGQHASDFTSSATDFGRSGVASDLYEGTTTLTNKYVNEGQVNAIASAMIIDTNITMIKIQRAGATTGQILKWTGSTWAPRNDSMGTGIFLPLAGGTMTGAITNTGDPAITMGKANFGTGNINPGTQAFVAGSNNKARGQYSVVAGGGGATTADSNSAMGQNSAIVGGIGNAASGDSSFIGGGARNIASNICAAVGGGYYNTASGQYAVVGGGIHNTASNINATVGGGSVNIANGLNGTVAGGSFNTASGLYATVCGGYSNKARGTSSVVSGGGGISYVDSNSALGFNSTISGGIGNIAKGDSSFIGGGARNIASNTCATVGGGSGNTASSYFATVGGGNYNTADDTATTIAGGKYNYAHGKYSVVSGGGGSSLADSNSAISDWSTIGGGAANRASNSYATIGGGAGNIASGWMSTIGGGDANSATGPHTIVSGGLSNIASGSWSTIGGGRYNRTRGYVSVISGGGGMNASDSNSAIGNYSTISGGMRNITAGHCAAIGGGESNLANDTCTTVSGGKYNKAYGWYSVVSGGGGSNLVDSNSAKGNWSTIGGGRQNNATDGYATIGGGLQNTAGSNGTIGGGANNTSGMYATVGGGGSNQATGYEATIAGGALNIASGGAAFIGGGYNNKARGNFSVVCGGGTGVINDSNSAIGNYSMILGGRNNIASGNYSFAAGRRAKANHHGAFVWADTTNTDFTSERANQFRVRANGGARFDVNNSRWVNIYDDAADLITTSSGAHLTVGGSWTNSSDRDMKENFTPVNGKLLLEKLSRLPITAWNYKTEKGVKHIGPVAQDFYAIFGLGNDDKSISTIDPAGIALAAIQELIKQNEELNAQNKDLAQKYQDLQTKLDYLLNEFETLKSQHKTDNK